MSPSTPELSGLPVLAISGMSGAGKTTLIEALLPDLVRQGLAVAVVKHSHHRLILDRPGKDSDRFFRAGADVYLHGDETFHRLHNSNPEQQLIRLGRAYDLVLVEGFKDLTLPKIWLHGPGEERIPDHVGNVIAALSRDTDRLAFCRDFLANWLPSRRAPLAGLVLIGGKSSRMGRPKHLLVTKGRTWIERSVDILQGITGTVAISGHGEIPPSLADLPRLPDCPGIGGPLAGILAASRWQPGASWLVMACDLPFVTADSLNWLLAGRRPGVWAVIPQSSPGRFEPLLAWYDCRMAASIEDLATASDYRLSMLAWHPRAATPLIPASLLPDFRNINSFRKLEKSTHKEGQP